MYIRDIIDESPLPDGWDGEVYNPRTSFASRIAYAKERAKKIGQGSSRVAFEIPYEGRKTILKIAKNKKGMAQNYAEAEVLNDYFFINSGFFIPMIDHQETEEDPSWLHVEYAEKIKPTEFKSFFGCDPYTLIKYAECFFKEKHISDKMVDRGEVDPEKESIIDFVDLVGNTSIHTADLVRLANWGKFKGHPVIIDAGLTQEIFDTMYRKR